MTSTQHPSATDNRHFVFDVRLDWISHQKGMLTAHDADGAIHVATPPAFGGEGKDWSPEHLFLGSIACCFMSTYLYFARKMKFDITHLECHAIGKIALVEGKLKFTHISLFPTIHIPTVTSPELADLAIVKAKKSCLISNSVSAEIDCNGKVIKSE